MNTRAVPRSFANPSPRGRTRVALLALVAFLIVLGGGVYWVSWLGARPPATVFPPGDQFSYRLMWPAEQDLSGTLTAAERDLLVRVCVETLAAAMLEKVPIGLANTPPPNGTIGLRLRLLRGFDVPRKPGAVQVFIANRPLRISEIFLARVPDMAIAGERGVIWAQTDLGRIVTSAPVALDAPLQALLTRLSPPPAQPPRPVTVTLWKPDGRPVSVPPDGAAFIAIVRAAEALAPLNDRTLAAATESTFAGGNLPPAWMVNPSAVTVAITYDYGLTAPSTNGVADTILLADAKAALPETSLIAAVGPWGGDLWQAVPLDPAAVAQQGPALHAAVVAALNAPGPAQDAEIFTPANAELFRSVLSKVAPGTPPDPASLAVIVEGLWYAIRWLPVESKLADMEPNGIQITWNTPVTVERRRWPQAPAPFRVFSCSVWFPNGDTTRIVVRFTTSLEKLVVEIPLTAEMSATTLRASVADAIKKLNGD